MLQQNMHSVNILYNVLLLKKFIFTFKYVSLLYSDNKLRVYEDKLPFIGKGPLFRIVVLFFPKIFAGNLYIKQSFFWLTGPKIFFWNAKREPMIKPSLQECVCECSFLGSLLYFTNLSLQGICLQQCLVYSICPEGLRNASLLVVGHIF